MMPRGARRDGAALRGVWNPRYAGPFGLCLLAACLSVTACGPAALADAIAFDDVTVIDAVDGARAGQRVVVDGDRIVSVMPMAEVEQGADTVGRVIDGAGRYLIPGLWDMHVHFLYDDALTDAMPRLFLRYGVTSVRDTGGDMSRLVALRERLETSSQPVPRMFIAGPLLDGRFVIYDGSDPSQPDLGVPVPSAEAARQKVAELAAAGADLIKIYELVNPDVFAALVAAADEQGLPIAAHVPLTMLADEAGPLVGSMEHMRNVELACAGDWRELLATRQQRIDDFEAGRGHDLRADLHRQQRLPAIAHYDEARCDAVLAALHETIQVPTLRLNTLSMTRAFEREDWPAALAKLPPEVARRWAASVEEREAEEDPEDTRFDQWSLFLAERMHDAGLPLGAGTDTPIALAIPGYSLHTELALLVRSGLSPLEALGAATLIPARFFGREDAMGRIAPGMAADLVLLAADPLADIENTRRIDGVMTRGRWLTLEALTAD